MANIDLKWLLPEVSPHSGGSIVAAKLSNLLNELVGVSSTLIVGSDTKRSLEQSFAEETGPDDCPVTTVLVVTVGPAVKQQIESIRDVTDAPILYFAQSVGWRDHHRSRWSDHLELPHNPDIACVSRYVMAQWQANAPKSRVGYTPPALSPVFAEQGVTRDIDIFCHTRKQSDYCIGELLPALRHDESLNVVVIDEWIDQRELAELLNRSRTFLYHTSLYTRGGRRYPLNEGFGLPPLEALACGAHVVSDSLGGTNDFLDQSNSRKLVGRAVEHDVRDLKDYLQQIAGLQSSFSGRLVHQYSEDSCLNMWGSLLLQWYR